MLIFKQLFVGKAAVSQLSKLDGAFASCRVAALRLRGRWRGEELPAAAVRPRLPPQDLPVRLAAFPEPRARRRPAEPARRPGEVQTLQRV